MGSLGSFSGVTKAKQGLLITCAVPAWLFRPSLELLASFKSHNKSFFNLYKSLWHHRQWEGYECQALQSAWIQRSQIAIVLLLCLLLPSPSNPAYDKAEY